MEKPQIDLWLWNMWTSPENRMSKNLKLVRLNWKLDMTMTKLERFDRICSVKSREKE